MTPEPEMTLDVAQAWTRANWASEKFDMNKYLSAKAFIAGHAAGLKESQALVKELVEAGSALKKYHAFIPDAQAFLRFEAALERGKECLK